MHDCGVNHRDCYLEHFLLSMPFDGTAKTLRITMIDLHRAQIRDTVPRRWRDKDLTALYSSALRAGLTNTDCWRFLKAYFGVSVREIVQKEKKLLQCAPIKARRIIERMRRHAG